MTLARKAARALGLRVAAIDLFTDIGGNAGATPGDRGQFQPVDPPAGAIRPRRPDPENLASHIFRDGTALVFDLPKYGAGVGLARMAELLEALAVDRARLTRISVVVTGSNGKGSTAAFCAGIGRAYGLRTGLFTSPHLYRFNERVQVDGVPIERCRPGAVASADRSGDRASLGAARRTIRRFRSPVRAGLPAFSGGGLRFRGVRGRHRRTL